MTVTYAQLEDRIRDHTGKPSLYYIGNARSLAMSIQIHNGLRTSAGLTHLSRPPAEGLWLLSPASSISKLEKGEGLANVALALAPADVGEIEVCPHRGACTDGCVAYAGNGSFERITTVRMVRKRLLTINASAFFTLLIHDLDVMVERHPEGFACRLNAFSDIRWERVLPAWFWERYAGVTFYDYTKHPLASRPMKSMPANYTLTYSWSEKTTKGAVRRNIDAGRNVAVVLSTRGGKHKGELRPIPAGIGDIPMVDGDIDDRRYDDPTGVLVGLRRKGTLGRYSPFVYNFDRALT